MATTSGTPSPTSSSDTGGDLGSLLSDFFSAISEDETPASPKKAKRKRGVSQGGGVQQAPPATPLLAPGALAPVMRTPGVAESIGAGLAPEIAQRGATAGLGALSNALTQQGLQHLAAQGLATTGATTGLAGALGGTVGRAIPIVGPLVGAAAQLGTQAAQGQQITGEDVGSATGGAVGGAGGAAAGAAGGAALGTVVPGIGNAVGALVGALIGGLAGGAGGSQGGAAIGRAAGGGKAKIAQAGSSQPYGNRYAPGSTPYEQGVGPRIG